QRRRPRLLRSGVRARPVRGGDRARRPERRRLRARRRGGGGAGGRPQPGPERGRRAPRGPSPRRGGGRGDAPPAAAAGGRGGSRVAANGGPAVARSARTVRDKATRVAADLLECAPADVRIAEGRAFVAGVSGRSIALGQLARTAVRAKVLRSAPEPGLTSCT